MLKKLNVYANKIRMKEKWKKIKKKYFTNHIRRFDPVTYGSEFRCKLTHSFRLTSSIARLFDKGLFLVVSIISADFALKRSSPMDVRHERLVSYTKRRSWCGVGGKNVAGKTLREKQPESCHLNDIFLDSLRPESTEMDLWLRCSHSNNTSHAFSLSFTNRHAETFWNMIFNWMSADDRIDYLSGRTITKHKTNDKHSKIPTDFFCWFFPFFGKQKIKFSFFKKLLINEMMKIKLKIPKM